jgi:hypothetical protein
MAAGLKIDGIVKRFGKPGKQTEVLKRIEIVNF